MEQHPQLVVRGNRPDLPTETAPLFAQLDQVLRVHPVDVKNRQAMACQTVDDRRRADLGHLVDDDRLVPRDIGVQRDETLGARDETHERELTS
jgi:hypothetical protein